MNIGKLLLAIGCIAIVAGLILLYNPRFFSWIGRLPGDIRFVSGRTSVYIPVASMLVISLLISFFLWLTRKLMH